jgi:biopolymer transport protein ExbD
VRHRIKSGYESRVQVAVTPFLDFAFQLLAFFLVTSHPSLPEGEMDLALPTEKPAVANESSSTDLVKNIGEQDDVPVEQPQVTVLIDTYAEGDNVGKIKEIFLSIAASAEGKPEERIPIAAEGWDADNVKPLMQKLQEQLKKLRETLTNKKDIIMKADRKLKWQYIVKVRDACEKAGFSNANFARK